MQHTVPTELECPICMENITKDNYIEYRISENSPWIPCQACDDCIEIIRSGAMKRYLHDLLHADCRRSQLRVLHKGPPYYLDMSEVFPNLESCPIKEIWHSKNDTITSGKVDDALEENERKEFIEKYTLLIETSDDNQIVKETDETN
ncbi:hypothetical protein WA158_001431 [Blastocystis sp. Blastoise]